MLFIFIKINNMNDKNYETVFYYCILILSAYPLFEIILGTRKWWFKGIIVILLSIFWFVSYNVKQIDDRDKSSLSTTVTGLTDSVGKMNAKLTIIEHKKDSLVNVIYKINNHNTYNSKIGIANGLLIGRH
jgi:hypothetical protein